MQNTIVPNMLEPSPEQEAVCAAVLQGNNVVATAVAGAGKSTTCFHIAKTLADTGAKTLMLCFNNALAAASVDRAAKYGLASCIDCMTVHGLASLMYGRSVHDTWTLYTMLQHHACSPSFELNYALIVIDEAQDLNALMLCVVRKAYELNADKGMQWLVIGDQAQEIYAYCNHGAQSLLANPAACLPDNGRPWVDTRLLLSYRLTAPVCTMLNRLFKCKIQPGNTKDRALAPEFIVGNAYDGHLRAVVLELLREYGVKDMMVLAPSVKSAACQKLCLQLAADHHVPVHMSTQGGNSDGKLVVSSFHQSKGLERKCVLIMGVGGFYERRWRSQPNPLHVALTRARERLVIFHHHMEKRLTPFSDQDRVSDVFKFKMLAAYEPVRRMPFDDQQPQKSRSYDAHTLTAFVPTDCVLLLLKAVRVSKTKPVGKPVTHTPQFAANGESVQEFYMPALLGAFEQLQGGTAQLLVRLGKHSRQWHLLPAYCQEIVRRIKHRADNAKEWLCAAMALHAIQHGTMHMPHQLRSMTWVGDAENAYFCQCMKHLTDLFCHIRGTVQMHVPLKRKTPDGTEIDTYAPILVTQLADDGIKVHPWIVTLDPDVTEDHMWQAALIMWACCVDAVRVFFIASNTVVQIVATPDLDSLVMRLVEAKEE